MRAAGARKELEAEFVGQDEGTLVLTNKRLIFVAASKISGEIPVSLAPTRIRGVQLFYSDVEDLDSVSDSPRNVFISLASITRTKGHKGGVGRPALEVEWEDDGKRSCVFTEVLTGRRRRNLDDWAKIIEDLRSGRQKLAILPPSPPLDTLDGKVTHVMGDMQEKGVFEIEEAVESEFKVDLEPDSVQAACDRLSSAGLLVRRPESGGEVYYRKQSPLGDANLSS